MNRYLSPTKTGQLTFSPGRAYRMVIVVNGPCDVEDLEVMLQAHGFGALASSTPNDWDSERPPDWPNEQLPAIAANECPVRVSGPYIGDGPMTFDEEWRIGDTDATAIIVQAWDAGAAPREQTTGAAAAEGEQKKSPLPVVGLAVASLGAFGLYNYWSANRRMKREQERLESAEARRERAEVQQRMQELVQGGYTRDQAEAAVEAELEDDEQPDGPAVVYIIGS